MLLALALLVGPWALAAAAMVRASRARARLESLEAKVAGMERALAARRAGAAAGPEMGAVPAARPEPPSPVSSAGAPPPGAGRPLETLAVGAAGAPPAASHPPPAPRAPAGTPRGSLEEAIALVWFSRIGAVALMLGAAYFFKYAVDNQWIGPTGRVTAGALAGAATLAFAEVVRSRSRPIFVQAVQGAGVALLFLVAYASHVFYRLAPAGVAFAAVAVVAVLGGALAVRGRGELVLVLSLVGGLLAPALLSTGQDRPGALFGYLLVLTALTLAAAGRLDFRFAPWFAMAGVAILFAGWNERFFDVHPPPARLDPDLPAAAQQGAYYPLAARAVPLGFAAAFLAEWLAVWVQARRRGRAEGWRLAWLLSAQALGHLAAAALLFDRAWPLGAALAGLGVLSAAALRRAGRAGVLWAPLALSFLILAGAAHDGRARDGHAWLGAAALWAAVYLGAVVHAWLRRREAPAIPLLAAASAAGLGFAGLVVDLTSADEQLLRAGLLGVAGAVDLALGSAILGRTRARASTLLGQALALFAGAAALLFSGATVTLVWAALAASAAWLAARERDRLWLAGSGLLFLATLARVATVDVHQPHLARDLWFSSLGAEGALSPRVLLNPRAYALGGTAAALLLSAWAAARAAERPFREAAAILAGVGHVALLALVVTEARGLALHLPAAPVASDASAFHQFRLEVGQAVGAQAGRLDMLTTLVMGGWAALLLGLGFAARSALHRWLGLGLFALTLAKLVMHDVWRLPRLYQIAVFLAVGVLLLAAAFLYARRAARGGAPPRNGAPPVRPGASAGGAALVLLAALSSPAWALDAAPFREQRAVGPLAGPGLWQVEVDADLYRHSLAGMGTLGDVRLVGPDGAEVAWALQEAPGGEPEEVLDAALVDPSVFPDGSVRAALDLGRPGLRHSEVRLDLSGEDFLRPVRVETSNDGRRWGKVAEGGRVYAVQGIPEARHTTVRYPLSDARWVRVTLLPGPGPSPRVQGGKVVRAAGGPPPLRWLDLPAAASAGPDGRSTRFDVDLGAPGLPVVEVRLDVEAGAFERGARVLASADGQYWTPVGGGLLWRAPAGRPAVEEGENLRLEVRPSGRRWLRVEVRDGDSPPLRASRAGVAWRLQLLVFRASLAGAYRILLGNAGAAAPAYDLAAVLARTLGVAPAPASLGPVVPNPSFAERSPAVPFSEAHRTALGAALLALLAALAVWVVRLLRSPPATGGGGP